MSVKYTVTYTRPSLDHLFVFELYENDLTYKFDDIENLCLEGLIDIKHDSQIEWLSIKHNQKNLRPDLYDKLFGSKMMIDTLIIKNSSSPYFNPFSLMHTNIYIFDCIENLQSAYPILHALIDDQVNDNRLNLTENTITQTISINNELIQPDWLLPFSI